MRMSAAAKALRIGLLLALLVGAGLGVWAAAKLKIANGLVMRVDARGKPRLYGVPLGNTNLQAVIYRGLASLGARVTLTFGPKSAQIIFTNDQALKNLGQTVNALKRAGLLQTNTNCPPTPAHSFRNVVL